MPGGHVTRKAQPDKVVMSGWPRREAAGRSTSRRRAIVANSACELPSTEGEKGMFTSGER